MVARVVVEAILPRAQDKPKAQFDRFWSEIERYLKRDVKRMLISDLQATTQGWNHKPEFTGFYSEPYGTQLQMHVKPTGRYTKQWQRVSDGTGPRMLVSGRGVMHFQPEYSPKTTPGGRYGGSGSKSGPWVHARAVGPHRIEPREFSKKVAEKREKKIIVDVNRIRDRVLG